MDGNLDKTKAIFKRDLFHKSLFPLDCLEKTVLAYKEEKEEESLLVYEEPKSLNLEEVLQTKNFQLETVRNKKLSLRNDILLDFCVKKRSSWRVGWMCVSGFIFVICVILGRGIYIFIETILDDEPVTIHAEQGAIKMKRYVRQVPLEGQAVYRRFEGNLSKKVLQKRLIDESERPLDLHTYEISPH